MTASWREWLDGELAGVRSSGRWRETRGFDAFGPVGTTGEGHVVSFASNDYLGLSTHPAVLQAAREAIDRWGTGATASPLVVGTRPCHEALEEALARTHDSDAAVVFPTGYHTNLAVLTVLGGPDVTILSDELNHASIIDGCRLSRSRVVVYRHRDLDQLAQLLRDTSGRVLVVTDAVFSMDGDVAPVHEIAALCADRGAVLVVDEAHAVLGPDVGGAPGEVVRVGTLSKTLGAQGGFVAAGRDVVDLVVNRARPFIFTTALSPPVAAAALAALAVATGAEGDALRHRLRGHLDRLGAGRPSPIVPLVVGSETDALAASAALAERGLLVPAIRPPTVPVGTSRLRVTLSAAHTDEMVRRLLAALGDVGLDPAATT